MLILCTYFVHATTFWANGYALVSPWHDALCHAVKALNCMWCKRSAAPRKGGSHNTAHAFLNISYCMLNMKFTTITLHTTMCCTIPEECDIQRGRTHAIVFVSLEL